jgi:hypothetical protein
MISVNRSAIDSANRDVALAKAGQQHHHRADAGKYQHEGRGERRQ